MRVTNEWILKLIWDFIFLGQNTAEMPLTNPLFFIKIEIKKIDL
jgi:hypothetical protein